MRYQSIIRLFDHCNIDCNTMDLGRIRKILTAEFSIANGGIILVDGFDYTKNDIFQELDHPDFPQRLAYHQLIWNNESLLACLEKNVVSFQYVYTWVELKKDPEFVRFISPYYAESYDKIMRKFLHPADFTDAGKWIRTRYFIDNAEDEDKAMSGVRVFISEFIRSLKNSNKETYVEVIPELECWINQPVDTFINNLPDSFYKQKDDLARAMINFTVVIQHVNKNLCYEVSTVLVSFTNLETELHNLILENHEIYASKARPTSKKSSGFNGWMIIPAFIFLINIVSICNRSTNSSSRDRGLDLLEQKKITAEYYETLRNKYAVVDTSMFYGHIDKPQLVISNQPCYMIFERSDSTSSVTVNIINEGHSAIVIYLKTDDDIVMDLRIDPQKSLKLTRSKSAFDMLLSNMGQSAITLPPSPLLISDQLNFEPHSIKLDKGRGIINIDQVDSYGVDDITMKIYSKPFNGGTPLDYMTFSNAHWIY